MSRIYERVPLPAAQHGTAHLERFTVLEAWPSPYPGILTPPGDYVRLLTEGDEWMNDTPADLLTSEIAWTHAHGHVLTMGLGLGAILPALLRKPDVTHITVVERSPDVIALVGPHYVHPRLTILQGDGLTWTPPPGVVFNTIWLDFLQPVIPPDRAMLAQMEALCARYRAYLDPTDPAAWCEHWYAPELREALL